MLKIVVTGILICLLDVTPCLAYSNRGLSQKVDLNSMSQAADIYYQNHGCYPQTDNNGTWYQKLVAEMNGLPLTTSGTTPSGDLPLDYHGRVIIYELPSPTVGVKPSFRSMGPDGIDNQGRLDDLDSRWQPAIGYAWKSGWQYTQWRFWTSIGIAIGGVIWLAYRKSGFPKLLWIGLAVVVLTPSGYSNSYWVHDPAVYYFIGVNIVGLICFVFGLRQLWYRGVLLGLRQQGNQCLACGYDLRGLPQATTTCPECGSLIASTPPAT